VLAGHAVRVKLGLIRAHGAMGPACSAFELLSTHPFI